MFEDLQPYLIRWPFEAGAVQVRTIQGKDGLMKLQLRLDLGILQMEMEGRPDGQTPCGCESLLDHYEKLAARVERQSKTFKLTSDDCVKLQQEGTQYYYRYIAFFHLENYSAVVRDTQRNLRLFDFIERYNDNEELGLLFGHFRPYVMLMLTRAKGMLAVEKKNFSLALKYIETGMTDIRNFLAEHFPLEVEHNSELLFLEQWMKEVQEKRPLTPREKLRRQMEEAIEKEDFERAARLRDALNQLD